MYTSLLCLAHCDNLYLPLLIMKQNNNIIIPLNLVIKLEIYMQQKLRFSQSFFDPVLRNSGNKSRMLPCILLENHTLRNPCAKTHI